MARGLSDMVLPRRRPMARRPEPARAPTLSPAPERRVERIEPERPPVKREEPNTIHGIVIDPQAKTVKEIRLKTEPGDERGGYGVQIAAGEAEAIVGVEDLESIDIGDGQVVVVDPLRQSEAVETWRLGETAEPIAGVGVVVGYDPDTDEYSDARLTLDEARKGIVWGDDEGARVDLIAKIADRLEALDGKQLQKVQAMLDEVEGADAGDGADEREETAGRPNTETTAPNRMDRSYGRT